MQFFKMKVLINISILYICFNSNTTYALRILGLFPFQVRSHFTMCEALMRGLAVKGHQVDVYSHFPLKKPIPNYKDFSLAGTLPDVSNNLTFHEALITSPTEMTKYWIQAHGQSICNLMTLPIFQRLFHNPPNDPPYDLVITELSVANCYVPWGRHLNVPVIGVVTPPLLDWMFVPFGNHINLASEPSILLPYSGQMSFFQRLDNVITHYAVRYTFKKYSRDQDEVVEKIFGPGFPSQIGLLKEVSLVLVNHDSSLSGTKSFPPLVVPVGGLHVVDHNETLPKIVQKWLDDSKDGCVYFSFGSMTRLETFPERILQALYKSFKNIAPVRVLLKIAKPEELPPGLPSNVLVQPWFQQIQVLKHRNVKAFVTHGGLMGTQESVYYGVPMIGIPLFADQIYNVEAYVKNNIAIKLNLDELTEETFTNSVREILQNPIYRNTMNEVSRQFKDRPLNVMDTAIFWVEYISRNGKDALKSAIVDMPWWQASLIDVYGFIIASICISTCVIIVTLKKLIKIFSFNIELNARSQKKKIK